MRRKRNPSKEVLIQQLNALGVEIDELEAKIEDRENAIDEAESNIDSIDDDYKSIKELLSESAAIDMDLQTEAGRRAITILKKALPDVKSFLDDEKAKLKAQVKQLSKQADDLQRLIDKAEEAYDETRDELFALYSLDYIRSFDGSVSIKQANPKARAALRRYS